MTLNQAEWKKMIHVVTQKSWDKDFAGVDETFLWVTRHPDKYSS